MTKTPIMYPEDFFDLSYRGTDTKVRLGDHVLFKRWFGIVKTPCRVAYVPGVSPPHKEMEYTEKAAMWAIEDEKGNAYMMLYVPEDKFISRRIAFVHRTTDEYRGFSSSTIIE